MSTLKAIRRLTDDERDIILSCMESKRKEWRDSEPLSPEEEDRLIDMNILYHNISVNQLSIDFPPED